MGQGMGVEGASKAVLQLKSPSVTPAPPYEHKLESWLFHLQCSSLLITWESSRRCLKYEDPYYPHGDLDGITGSWFSLAQLWLMHPIRE